MGISETHWTGQGKIQIDDGMSIIYSGRDDEIHREGVAIMLTKEAGDALIDWVPISERIIKARFFSKHIKLTMIHTYVPTEGADEQIKDEFYEKFQETIQQVSKHDLLIVTCDMNAKVGNDNESYEQVMGKQGIGTRNENGSRLCEMCDMNDLVITGTIFPHRHIHLATRKSPDNTTLNQIDQTLVNKRFRNSVLDTRAMKSADIGSDHYLVRTTVRLKLKRTPKAKDDNSKIRFDTDKLKQEVFRSRFDVTVRNKREVKRQIRTDKRDWADTIASEAEAAANSHQMRTLYRLTNILSLCL